MRAPEMIIEGTILQRLRSGGGKPGTQIPRPGGGESARLAARSLAPVGLAILLGLVPVAVLGSPTPDDMSAGASTISRSPCPVLSTNSTSVAEATADLDPGNLTVLPPAQVGSSPRAPARSNSHSPSFDGS